MKSIIKIYPEQFSSLKLSSYKNYGWNHCISLFPGPIDQ